jgi:hypothetical protein
LAPGRFDITAIAEATGWTVAAALILVTLLGMTQVTETAISAAEHDPAS